MNRLEMVARKMRIFADFSYCSKIECKTCLDVLKSVIEEIQKKYQWFLHNACNKWCFFCGEQLDGFCYVFRAQNLPAREICEECMVVIRDHADSLAVLMTLDHEERETQTDL